MAKTRGWRSALYRTGSSFTDLILLTNESRWIGTIAPFGPILTLIDSRLYHEGLGDGLFMIQALFPLPLHSNSPTDDIHYS